MIDFKEIPYNGDEWEQFARDFLSELGFYIESPPDRGADGGKDLIITETVKGRLHQYSFRWLVSCKHFATSGKSVNENDDEKNILERVKSFKADGFLGFYSTIPSSGLNTRLHQLRQEKEIKDYKIFDGKLIEKYLLDIGFSSLVMRFFPDSNKTIRPHHLLLDEYIELKCEKCGKDLLKALYEESYKSIIAQVTKYKDDKLFVLKTYFACKGECDRYLDDKYYEELDATTSWHDISDLAIPTDFLRWIWKIIDQLHSKNYEYSDDAIKQEKLFITAMAQKVFRESTEKEKDRIRKLIEFGM